MTTNLSRISSVNFVLSSFLLIIIQFSLFLNHDDFALAISIKREEEAEARSSVFLRGKKIEVEANVLKEKRGENEQALMGQNMMKKEKYKKSHAMPTLAGFCQEQK